MKLNDLNKNECFLEWGDCSHALFLCHDNIKKEFYNYLSIKKKNVNRDLVKLGIEDEYHRFYNPINYSISRGHIKHALEFCKDKDYDMVLGANLKLIKDLHPKTDNSFFDNLPLTIGGKKVDPWSYPYDYQGKFIDWALKNRAGIGISATGSGKTLISYCIMRYLQAEAKNQKIMFIVPSITLVKQGYNDFADFSETDKDWDVSENVSMLHGTTKDKKNFNNILITTWQSIKGKRKSFYESYDHILVDEVHGADANVLKRTIEKCTNAYSKIGMTGSLKGVGKNIDAISKMSLEGLFGGRIEIFSTVRELIDRGVLPDLKMMVQELNYDKKFKKEMDSLSEIIRTQKLDYRDKLKLFNEEKKYVYTLEKRNNYMFDLLNRLKGNVIIFFSSVDNLKAAHDAYDGPKNKYAIYGNIIDSKRQDILYDKIMNSETDCVLFATYGTLSTGVSVSVLDIAIMWESMKSRVKVLQSIGRMLRGTRALVIDICDNIDGKNYLYNHAQIRKELYISVEYSFMEQKININFT